MIGLTSVSGYVVMRVIISVGKELAYDEQMGVYIRYSFLKASDFEVNLGTDKTHTGGLK